MKGNKFFKKIDRYLGIPLVFLAGLFCGFLDLLTRPSTKPLSPGNRVLVVKLSALGDTLLLLPLFKALKQKVGPEGRILMVATSINQAALENFPHVDETLVLDFGLFLKNPAALWRFLRRLRGFRPTLALDFDQWLRVSPLLCFLSGAARRYGFKTPGQHRHFLYGKTMPNKKGTHEVEQFASVAALAGIDPASIENYNGFLEREGLFRGETPLAKPVPGTLRVHFHPGCGSYGWQRAWPEGSYARLAQDLSGRARVEIRITGMGAYEEDLVRGIIQSSGVAVRDFSGRLEISRLAGLLREADLVVCGNTGLMHLAVGLGKPLVVLNGPADPVKWGPAPFPTDGAGPERVRVLSAGLLCSPCTNLGFEYGCPYRSCMEAIEERDVLRECLELLAAAKVG
jgi:ADP-heptose:LPS heptosyltransferase